MPSGGLILITLFIAVVSFALAFDFLLYGCLLGSTKGDGRCIVRAYSEKKDEEELHSWNLEDYFFGHLVEYKE